MPKGIYIRTEEHRKALVEIGKKNKGKHPISTDGLWNINKEELEKMYREEGKSFRIIGKNLEVNADTVRRHFKTLDIKSKTKSEALRGDKNPSFGKDLSGEKGPFFGKHHTAESKEKMSLILTGENNGNWKGGVTPINLRIRGRVKYKQWRTMIFERDNYTCQKCNKRGGKLHAHHIQNFSEHPELRFDPENGITFCKKHHKEFHHLYGKKNNIREQVNRYINGGRCCECII